ncbi:hypothetical protein Ae168Ps1_3079c [Pseudonocardia sp. Ae168_Ps1]|nr:hypothetical protein Ae168Ps1_3079c [Pseudonocardia sp. Ae168_Ps1]
MLPLAGGTAPVCPDPARRRRHRVVADLPSVT